MKRNLTPEQRAEAARIVTEIRADLRELRAIFERLHERLTAAGR